MLQRLKVGLIILVFMLMLVGCDQRKGIENTENNKITIFHQELTDKEKYLMQVTGNNVVMYNLDNFTEDKEYKMELYYEEYKEGEKIKEDLITGIYHDSESPKVSNKVLTLNYQEDKIRFVIGEQNGYSSGTYDIEDEFEERFINFFTNEASLSLGDEIYIYQGSKGMNPSEDTYVAQHFELGVAIDKKEFEQFIKDTEQEVFIRLVYEEINENL